MVYDLALVNRKTQAYAGIASGADLYLPYPESMDMAAAEKYDFTVSHYTGYHEEIFSTRNGGIELTPYGLRLRITSMSPFLLTWTEAPVTADLPQTGDGSAMGLWMILLFAAGALALNFRRRNA